MLQTLTLNSMLVAKFHDHKTRNISGRYLAFNIFEIFRKQKGGGEIAV